MFPALTRRKFLATAIAVGAPQAIAFETPPPEDDARQTLDIHLHLLGSGDSGSGCRISQKIAAGPLFQFLSNKLQLENRANTLDEAFVLALAEQLQQSGHTSGVILAQDAVYDSTGKPDWRRTSFFVPNDYAFKIAERFPGLMIPCASINPQRADALEELARVAAKGARVLKIHPPIQGVDLMDKSHIPFFRKCADSNFVLMVHTGYEHSAPTISNALANPRKLTLCLEAGCKVVACHSGTGWPTDPTDMLPDFLAMIRKHKNLWGDTSVLGTALRGRDLSRLLADDVARDRLLHGSDFPFPAAPLAFAPRIGIGAALRLQNIDNIIQQDFLLKTALGVGQESAERAFQLICNPSKES